MAGIRNIRGMSKRSLFARWRKRQREVQICGVVRHAERADGTFASYHGGRWTQTEDFHRWPTDPPLSDAGRESAKDIAQVVHDFAAKHSSAINVVITSPYLRCIETAIEITRSLGPEARMIVDVSIGEIFGPSIMGDREPPLPVRPLQEALALCHMRGVRCLSKSIGAWPSWPETLRDGRRRYADRFLRYLQRSATAQKNFILVTHADCVGAAFTMMPSQSSQLIEKIDYGGMFLGSRAALLPTAALHRRHSLPGHGSSSSSATPRGDRDNDMVDVVPTANFSSEGATGGHGSDDGAGDGEVSHGSAASFRRGLTTPRPLVLDSASADEGGGGGSHWMRTLTQFAVPAPKDDEESWCWNLHTGATPPITDQSWSPPWVVQTANLVLHRRPDHQKSLGKRLRTITKNNTFSVEQLLHLLGEMPEDTLGVHTEIPPEHETYHAHGDSFARTCSFSTYAFGASDIGSNLCPDSERNTLDSGNFSIEYVERLTGGSPTSVHSMRFQHCSSPRRSFDVPGRMDTLPEIVGRESPRRRRRSENTSLTLSGEVPWSVHQEASTVITAGVRGLHGLTQLRKHIRTSSHPEPRASPRVRTRPSAAAAERARPAVPVVEHAPVSFNSLDNSMLMRRRNSNPSAPAPEGLPPAALEVS